MKTSSLLFKIAAFLLISALPGCQKEEEERSGDIITPSSKDIIIQLSDVSIHSDNGWEVVNTKSANSEVSTSPRQSNENGLDMDISTSISPEPQTRTTSILVNSKLRVVAYRCTSIGAIAAGNYAGYGEYTADASGNLTATKVLAVPPGTYTFVFYTYGTTTLPAFDATSTTATVKCGEDFLSSTKAGVTINANYGKYFQLSGLTLTRRTSRLYITMQAQDGHMDKITKCAATLTVPAQAAYDFTTDKLANGSGSGSVRAVWDLTEADKMKVKSGYVNVLPQASTSIPMTFTELTIGDKSFAGTKATIAAQVFQGNYSYESVISLTTTGYIIGCAIWATGNLYYNGSNFLIYSNMSDINTASPTIDYWYWNRLYPTLNYEAGDFNQTT